MNATSTTRPGGSSATVWRAAVSVAAVAVVACAGAIALVRDPSALMATTGHLEATSSAVVAMAMWWAAWRSRAAARRTAVGWRWLAAAYSAFSVGEVADAIWALKIEPTSVGLSFLGIYLLFYPLFLLGALDLPKVPLSRRERWALLIDSGIVILAAGLILWMLVVRPTLLARNPEPFMVFATIVYPLGDLILLWAILTLVLREREGAASAVYGLLASSAVVLILTDLIYSLQVLAQYLEADTLLSLGWTASLLLAGLAAVRQGTTVTPDAPQPAAFPRRQAPSTASLYLAFGCLVTALLLVLVKHLEEISTLSVLLVLGMLGLVAVRKILGIRENTRLHSELTAARNDLERRVEERTADLAMAYDTTLQGWSRALELRDHETQGHALRVVDLTVRLAHAMGVREEDIIHVRRGALLHDIGKMGIPDSILLKPGPLTEEEWEVMRRHPDLASELLAPIDYLRPALDIPFCHHENWDGSGYPRSLKGAEIPLAARIFAVVDAWDALSRDRPYRQAWPRERVVAHLRSMAGVRYDPEVVDTFVAMVT